MTASETLASETLIEDSQPPLTAPLPVTPRRSPRCGGSDDDEPLVLEMQMRVIEDSPADQPDEDSLAIVSATTFVYMTFDEFLLNHGFADARSASDEVEVVCLKRVWRAMMLDGSLAKRFRKE